MRLTHYDESKKRWQINDDYGAVAIDDLNYAVGEAIDKLAAYEDAEEQGKLVILLLLSTSLIQKIFLRSVTGLE